MNLRVFKILYQSWWRGKHPIPPYSHIVQIGDPVLRQIAKPVDIKDISSNFIQELNRKLYQLMKKTGAVGMSAPQVGVPLRVFAVSFPPRSGYSSPTMYEHREMEPIPFQIWINPELKVIDYDNITFDESCESMKGFSAEVPRYKKVLLTGFNHLGEPKSWEAKGWSARIVQHEMDHLDGKLFVDAMNSKSISCSCWDVINRKGGRIYITYMPGK